MRKYIARCEINSIILILDKFITNILKLKNQNDFNNRNSIITIKNHDEIVNILKRYFENNILNENIISILQQKKYNV